MILTDSGGIPEFRTIPADSVGIPGFRWNSRIPADSVGIPRFRWNSRIPADSGGICGGIKSIDQPECEYSHYVHIHEASYDMSARNACQQPDALMKYTATQMSRTQYWAEGMQLGPSCLDIQGGVGSPIFNQQGAFKGEVVSLHCCPLLLLSKDTFPYKSVSRR